MWQIDNRTPFAAAGTWTRDRDGREIWIVCAKATFAVAADGALTLAVEQMPVLLGPLHQGEPGRSSLRHEADLVRTKTTTDIVLIGSAYALAGRQVSELDVGLRVGPVVKRLRVFGERRWRLGKPGKPEPFAQMPIVYERAYGGTDPKPSGSPQWDVRNPVGSGYASSADHLHERVANIETLEHPIASWSDRPPPAGFGPLESHWQARARWAGTYDERWLAERHPLLPLDFDDRFYQFAPADQQAPQFLIGGERVGLRGLSPHGDLEFILPSCTPTFETRFYKGPPEKHAGRLHSVVIDTDAATVSLLTHTALPCDVRGDFLERTVVNCDWARLQAYDASTRLLQAA